MIQRDEVFRIKTVHRPGTLARVLAAIAGFEAQIGEIETIHVGHDGTVRDVTVNAPGGVDVESIHAAIDALDGVEVDAVHIDKVFKDHRHGKIEVRPTVEVRNLQDMRQVYTPGVARVVEAIRADPSAADEYTWRARTVAVVSDGSRVLGLGDVGAAASLPVMEGKALFYPMLVELNAVPIVLDVADPDQFVATVRAIAPGFAAIHLEDIATPAAYAIEDELDRRLPVPVMHDDQHGTAVVVIAAVLSAARLLGRPLERLRFGQFGLGAAGSAIARLALEFPFTRVVAFDPDAAAVARVTALSHGDRRLTAGADDDARDAALDEVDILVMTTGQAGLLPPERVHSGQAVFALSNPLPEITPEAALAAGAAIATDGAIVNNVLAYPGLFRGALDAGAGSISPAMKRAAARALTRLAPDDLLLPDPLDRDVHLEVAAAVAAAAG